MRGFVGLALICIPLAWLAVWLLRPDVRIDLDPRQIQPETGQAYVTSVARQLPYPYIFEGDSMERGYGAPVHLFENSKQLGPANTLHQSIRESGGGAFSHWGGDLWFSSSDATDPRLNGYHYVVHGKAELRHNFVLIGFGLSIIALTLAWKIFPISIESRAAKRCVTTLIAVAAAFFAALSCYEIYDLSLLYPVIAPDSLSYLANNVTRGFFYPMILYGSIWLGPSGYLLVPLQLTLLILSFAALGYAIARLIGSPVLGAFATLLLVLNTGVLAFSALIMTEALFVSMIAFHVAASLAFFRENKKGLAATASLAAGLAILARPAGYSLLVGLLALPFLARQIQRQLFVAAIVPAVGLIGIGSLVNYLNQGAFFTHSIGGLSLFGHVLHLANPVTDTPPQQLSWLYKIITTKTASETTAAQAAFPIDYWRTTSNEYNKLLWGIAIPIMHNDVLEHAQQQGTRESYDTLESNLLDEFNRISMRLALSIIRDHPYEYVRHVAAHLIGGWSILFKYQGTQAALVRSYSKDMVEYARWERVKNYFSGRYPAMMLDRRLTEKSEVIGVPDRISMLMQPILHGATMAYPVIVALLGFVLWTRLQKKQITPLIAALAFCAVQIGSYFFLLATTQAAIARYCAVMEPFLLVAFILCGSQIFTALAQLRGAGVGKHAAASLDRLSR